MPPTIERLLPRRGDMDLGPSVPVGEWAVECPLSASVNNLELNASNGAKIGSGTQTCLILENHPKDTRIWALTRNLGRCLIPPPKTHLVISRLGCWRVWPLQLKMQRVIFLWHRFQHRQTFFVFWDFRKLSSLSFAFPRGCPWASVECFGRMRVIFVYFPENVDHEMDQVCWEAESYQLVMHALGWYYHSHWRQYLEMGNWRMASPHPLGLV